MRGWAGWYKVLIAVWLILALPGAVIGYGMSGGDIEVPTDVLGLILWLPLALFTVSPVVLWPWRKLECQS